MKYTGFTQLLQSLLTSATLLIACGSLCATHAATLTISPSSGNVTVGVPFTVNVSVSGLDPANDLFDYSFNLAFNPSIFEALTAGDGAIFNYAGNSPVYIDGTIDNVNGLIGFEGGLDTDASFVGTGGLLGTFTFDALAPATGATIAVQDVSLSTLNAASNLLPPDIDSGVLPMATLNVGTSTSTPEPATGALAGAIVAFFALQRFAKARKGDWASELPGSLHD